MKKLLCVLMFGMMFGQTQLTAEMIALERHQMLEGLEIKCVTRTEHMVLESINRISSVNVDENPQHRKNFNNLQNSLNSIISSSIKTLASKGELTNDDWQNILTNTGAILSIQIRKKYGVTVGINTSAPTGRCKDDYWITFSKE